MRRYLFGLLFVLLISTVIQAQDGATQWFYAIDNETDVLYTFNINGDVNELGTVAGIDSTYRIDETRMLFHVENDDDTEELRLVTPTEMQTITIVDEGYLPMAYHPPYVVLMPTQPHREATPALLINLDTATTTQLMTASRLETRVCCAFSADGSTLRYAYREDVSDDGDIADYELRERDLATGEEITFYSIHQGEDDFVSFAPTQTGDAWLIRRGHEVDSERYLAYQLVQASGEQADLGDFAMSDEQVTDIRLFERYLTAWQPRCENDCTLTLTSIDTDSVQTFAIGDFNNVPVPIYHTDNEFIVGFRSTEIVRLRTDAPPELLGFWSPRYVGPDYMSPDGRWIVGLDAEEDPSTILIYDLNNHSPAHVLIPDEIHHIPVAITSDFISMIPYASDVPYTYIDTTTGTMVTWDVLLDYRAAVEIYISENQALVTLFGSEDLEGGIYLVEHDSGTFTPLMMGMMRMFEGRHVSDIVARWQH